jgi:mono/diheme cytochrome c family protein
MRWTRWTSLGASLGAAIVAIVAVSCSGGQQAPAEMTLTDKIARGRELSFASGCNDCHTPGGLYGAPDTTRMLSGSDLGWEGPWGVSYARNLTPDTETGIGRWSEADIVTALRQGRRPDGSPVLPPMPWPGYAHMSDADAQALAAFIKSLPPVSHGVPDRVPPGQPATGPKVTIPPPPAWDAQNLPPAPAPGDTSAATP